MAAVRNNPHEGATGENRFNLRSKLVIGQRILDSACGWVPEARIVGKEDGIESVVRIHPYGRRVSGLAGSMTAEKEDNTISWGGIEADPIQLLQNRCACRVTVRLGDLIRQYRDIRCAEALFPKYIAEQAHIVHGALQA